MHKQILVLGVLDGNGEVVFVGGGVIRADGEDVGDAYGFAELFG